MRKRKLLEELDAAHHATDYWLGLVQGRIKKNEELQEQNAELRIENAVLKERLRKNPPVRKEDLSTD